MQKHTFYVLLLVSVLGLVSCTASYVVRERPAAVVYTRPVPPSREHVWISGNWVWAGGRYEWREGHWEKRREGHRWVDGYWQSVPKGYKWVPGHWA